MLISKFLSRAEPQSALVVLVHGRAGNLNVMQTFQHLIPKGVSVVSVQAPLADSEGGYSWWHFNKAGDFTEKPQTEIFTAANGFIDWLQEFLEEQQLKPAKIVALGFSQGAALLSCVIQSRMSLFCGVALLAGFVVKLAESDQNISDKESRPSVFVAHGLNDKIVPISVAQKGAEYLTQRGYPLNFISDEVGHKVGSSGMRALKAWLEGHLSHS